MTKFGVVLRKIRLDKQELLKDMAAKLKVSSAFLSAVETGKKRIPEGFVDKVCNVYALSKTQKEELNLAADMSIKEMKIDLSDVSSAQHQMALSFAKTLHDLTDEEITEIMRVFEKRTKKRGGRN